MLKKKPNEIMVKCEELDNLDFSSHFTANDEWIDTIFVAGIECPRNIRPLVKRILRRLRKEKIIHFRCDDGVGQNVMTELKAIIHATGLGNHENGDHELTIWLDDKIATYVYV